MNELYLDLETYGTTPLKSHGAHRYAQDAEVMLISQAWDDTDASVIDCSDGTPFQEMDDLQYAIRHADRVITHGAFDRIMLAGQQRPSPVIIPLDKHEDVMITAFQHGFPGGLDKLCDILDVPVDEAKDKEGGKLINLFCSPTPSNWKLDRATKHSHPEEWKRFMNYARLDVEAMRAVRRLLPTWNCTPLERQLWLHDQASNARGMCVDLDHAHAAIAAYDRVKFNAKGTAHKLTGGLLTSVNQRDLLLKILTEEYGWEGNLTKGTLEKVMRGEIDPRLRELLTLRLKASAASPAKYKALIKATGSDGRLRDTLQFCGASRTGRDSGRIFQPQNLPRPTLEREEVEVGIRALKADCAELVFDVSELVVSAVRGSIVAKPGHKLLVADLSNIEGRMLAWLAGEEWKLQAFRDYDAGIGEEIYRLTAGVILGIPPGDITDDQRQKMGKVPELACGYQGALGAFRQMGGAKVEKMSDDEIIQIVKGWRARHPKTKDFWYAMDAAARGSIGDPSKAYKCGRIIFDMADGPDAAPYLRMRLPSSRYLCYRRPTGGIVKCKICDGMGATRPAPDQPYNTCMACGGEGGAGSDKIQFFGVNQKTKQWQKIDTYGGKLTENATQAAARDVFFHGLHLAEQAGYPIILRVHDELVAEVPIDSPLTLEGLIECMTTVPVWATGLPLAAKGFETTRYYKD